MRVILLLSLAPGSRAAAEPGAPSTSAPAGSPQTPPSTASSPTATPPAGGSQTVAGDGFTVQAPAGWTVHSVPGTAAMISPIDVSRGIPGIPVTVSVIPTPPPLVPADMAAGMLDSNRTGTVVESESQVTIAGRQGTRLVTLSTHRVDETSDATSTTRTIKFYLPLDAGILLLQSSGPDEFLQPLMPQIDAMIESLSLQ